MRTFPVLQPEGAEDSAIVAAWRFAKQKYAREVLAHTEYEKQKAACAPMSVVMAEAKKLDFAESETDRAVLLLFQEQRADERRRFKQEAAA